MSKDKDIEKWCRFHTICNRFYEASFTCTNGGGSYCGKYREYDTIFRDKPKKNLINIKILLMEEISGQ